MRRAREPSRHWHEADALVVFTPSGKRGRFALGTPVLTAARQLGVDIDSVCGGRGICGRCQVRWARAVRQARHHQRGRASVARSRRSSSATQRKRGLQPRAGGCPARRSSWATSSSTCRPTARCTGRWCASAPRCAPSSSIRSTRLHYVEVERARHARAVRRLRAARGGAGGAVGPERAHHATCESLRDAAEGAAQGRLEGHRAPSTRGQRDRRLSGRASTSTPTASRSTSARPPSPAHLCDCDRRGRRLGRR